MTFKYLNLKLLFVMTLLIALWQEAAQVFAFGVNDFPAIMVTRECHYEIRAKSNAIGSYKLQNGLVKFEGVSDDKKDNPAGLARVDAANRAHQCLKRAIKSKTDTRLPSQCVEQRQFHGRIQYNIPALRHTAFRSLCSIGKRTGFQVIEGAEVYAVTQSRSKDVRRECSLPANLILVPTSGGRIITRPQWSKYYRILKVKTLDCRIYD